MCLETNQGWTVTFEVQGTNGPADMFTTTNLSGNHITNAQWFWLERGPACAVYQYTNQSAAQSYFILGSMQDADTDGLTDAYETLVSKTDPTDADTDNDGMPDGWEVQNQLNPFADDSGDDPDGDWLTNLQEYNGGSNSTNPHDVMVIAWGDNRDGQCNVPLNLRDVIAIAAGQNYSLALRSDGTVAAWGNNGSGQTNVPTNLTNAIAVAAGSHHALALRSDTTALIWGDWWTQYGYSAADFPTNWSNIAAVASGADHELALLNNGEIWTWSFYASNSAPYTQVPVGLPPVQAIAAGWDHSVALLSDGTVRAWGLGYSGYGWNLTNVPSGLSNVAAIAAGAWHTLALRNNGTVVAWGAGNGTNLSNNFLNSEQGQSIVPAGLSNVVAIAAGGYHSQAVRSDGTVVGWGDNLFGESTTPAGLTNITAIAAGAEHTLAIRSGRLTPFVLQNPSDKVSPPGSNVTFTAFGLGLAEVHYQWQFNGTNIAQATNASLTLNTVSANDEGSYRVIISTGAGSVTSSVAIFTLVRPPQVVAVSPPLGVTWIPTNTSSSVSVFAAGTNLYPLRYQWERNGTNITGATQSARTLTTQFIPAAALDGDYSVLVTNIVGITNVGDWRVRALYPGMVAGWGRDSDGQCTGRPPELTNAISISAGQYHSVAAREDGGVNYWGYEWDDLPTDLTNIVAVSAGFAHTLALRENGTVSVWGESGIHANSVPGGLNGVKAIAAGTYHNVALHTNGVVTAWGLTGLDWNLTAVPADLTNATAVAAGTYHSLALRADGTVESWGYSESGQTNVPSGLSNVVAVAAGRRHSLALKSDGHVAAWGQNGEGQCNVPAGLSNVMAIAAGWEHSAALKNDGTMVCWGENGDGQTSTPTQLTNVKMIAAGGDHTLATIFSPLVQYPVEVTKDLLLIYNSSSSNSSFVKDYYLAHRPMVSGANVLGIACTTNETFLPDEYTNVFAASIQNWLDANPTKRPAYVILFLDIPSRVNTNNTPGVYAFASPSVSYRLNQEMGSWHPFVTHINMDGTNDCRAYIDKLEFICATYSPGKLVISASDGNYGNTNYVVDDVQHEDFADSDAVWRATNGLLAAGVSTSAIAYQRDLEPCINGLLGRNPDTGFCTNGYGGRPHITNTVNVAGYISWGFHSQLGNAYAVYNGGIVKWSGNSSWYIVETIESNNGKRVSDSGNFLQWFSTNAFGGMNYANTPVGAVSHTDEPFLGGVNDVAKYFGLWATGKNFGISAWNSRNTPYFQAVGDPLVTR